uniref:Uncharacterized protein n=1 Tax=Physcomitrium patens TaxID=3218 RepID=A0A2K1JGZ9_PHYPA|nr:hypothetical protein PHYPA_018192 [Physcomitrium patens]
MEWSPTLRRVQLESGLPKGKLPLPVTEPQGRTQLSSPRNLAHQPELTSQPTANHRRPCSNTVQGRTATSIRVTEAEPSLVIEQALSRPLLVDDRTTFPSFAMDSDLKTDSIDPSIAL